MATAIVSLGSPDRSKSRSSIFGLVKPTAVPLSAWPCVGVAIEEATEEGNGDMGCHEGSGEGDPGDKPAPGSRKEKKLCVKFKELSKVIHSIISTSSLASFKRS